MHYFTGMKSHAEHVPADEKKHNYFYRCMCVGKNTAQAAGAKIMRAAGCNSFRRLFSQQLRDLHGVGGCALAHLVAAAPNVQAVVRG